MQAVSEQHIGQDEMTKKCPYCAEEIQSEAIKCRYCGEFLEKQAHPKVKWYYSTSTVIIALLCLGPLGLPLVWWNPRYKALVKLILTIVVIIVSIVVCYATVDAYENLSKQIEALGL